MASCGMWKCDCLSKVLYNKLDGCKLFRLNKRIGLHQFHIRHTVLLCIIDFKIFGGKDGNDTLLICKSKDYLAGIRDIQCKKFLNF